MTPLDPRLVDEVVQAHWPEAACELRWRDPWGLVLAVILSARATDTAVNRVLAQLDEHLLGIHAYAVLDPRDLEPLLIHLPLYRQKARSVVEAARAILDRFGGVVPQNPRLLETLPGIGRKTANVVAGNAWGIPAIGADTHVNRLAFRFAWTARESPGDAERAIEIRFPPERWVRLCHQLIRLGRHHCKRANPKCAGCPLGAVCPRQGVAP